MATRNATKKGWVSLTEFREKYGIKKFKAVTYSNKLKQKDIDKYPKTTFVREEAMCKICGIEVVSDEEM